MKRIDISEATGSLAEYVRDTTQEPVIVMEGGRPVAALVPIEDADLETVSLSSNAEFIALIERSRLRHGVEAGISPAEMRRRLGLKQ
ncbi:MAG: type II toxin-antitoxin system prevent-host-death family antitoxin [Thermodesulfobacteriota bacterium]